ncbi:hypothetical protein A6R68_21367 [Neotoma lepida]|uniref:Uncharacterized protein n=1 Tax=Neotoma lepida TaxID=56216 RepID=A0A1A6HRS8_NEOLE|nr:hypothetical protein A6R68_21367 [Neotoma lepida]
MCPERGLSIQSLACLGNRHFRNPRDTGNDSLALPVPPLLSFLRDLAVLGAGEPSRMQVETGREVRPALGARRRRVPGCLSEAESPRPRSAGSARVGACASVLHGADPPGDTSFLDSEKQLLQFEAETHFQCACCNWN